MDPREPIEISGNRGGVRVKEDTSGTHAGVRGTKRVWEV